MAHRSIKGIEDTLATMKRADNRWADKYVLDVGHLLMKLKEAHAAGEQAGLRRAREMIIEQAKPRWLTKAEKELLTETAAAILAEAGEK